MMSTMCRDPMYGELLRRNPGLMAQHNLPPMLPASYPVNIMDDAQVCTLSHMFDETCPATSDTLDAALRL